MADGELKMEKKPKNQIQSQCLETLKEKQKYAQKLLDETLEKIKTKFPPDLSEKSWFNSSAAEFSPIVSKPMLEISLDELTYLRDKN